MSPSSFPVSVEVLPSPWLSRSDTDEPLTVPSKLTRSVLTVPSWTLSAARACVSCPVSVSFERVQETYTTALLAVPT